jgi:HlyD family secretion protein
MKSKNIILTFLILIGIGAILFYYFSRKSEKAFQWRTVPIDTGTISIVVTATGSINALTTVQVGTQVSGTISKLFADFNTVVRKGQIVALLDTTFLAASRDDAASAVDKAKIQLNQMKTEFDRVKKLFEGNAVAQADYDLALTNHKSAQSMLKSAEAQFSRAKINLQYATIRAPISGVVISRNVDVGQTVVASFNTPTLFTIANDLTKMQVYANIDEADIGQIKVGQKVDFTVDAYPNESFVGVIKQIRLQPNVIQNVVNYTVIIDVANPELKLLPGLTANINVKVKEHNKAFKVPSNVLHFVPPQEYLDKQKASLDTIKEQWKKYQAGNFTEGDTAFVWVKQGNYLFPRKIKIGLSDGTFTEISGDIKSSDEVVLGISKEKSSATQTKNPFMPSMPQGTKRIMR